MRLGLEWAPVALALLGAGLCFRPSAPCGAASWAAAGELARGYYSVAPSTRGAVPLFVEVEATDGAQTSTRTFTCVLPDAEASRLAHCPRLGLSLPVELVGSNDQGWLIAVDYLGVEIWAENDALELLAVHPVAPPAHGAEAQWTGPIDRWVCAITQDEIDRCNVRCGTEGSTVRASPHPLNPSDGLPASEPQCKIECDCEVAAGWIDMPRVVPAF